MTNFYYETESADDDILDEEGNVIDKGLRKYGVCKEERHLPIVQMGLVITTTSSGGLIWALIRADYLLPERRCCEHSYRQPLEAAVVIFFPRLF